MGHKRKVIYLQWTEVTADLAVLHKNQLFPVFSLCLIQVLLTEYVSFKCCLFLQNIYWRL